MCTFGVWLLLQINCGLESPALQNVLFFCNCSLTRSDHALGWNYFFEVYVFLSWN